MNINEKHHNYKHGLSDSRIYYIHREMKSRCHNKNSYSYNNYGAKGIKVCDEWRNDFMAFYNWSMANGYTNDLTIDRIDPKGNYEPSNCRWVTPYEQILFQDRNKNRKKEDKYISKKDSRFLVDIHFSRNGFKNFKQLMLKSYKTLDEARKARDYFLKNNVVLNNDVDLRPMKKEEDFKKYINSEERELLSKKKNSKKRRKEIRQQKGLTNL